MARILSPLLILALLAACVHVPEFKGTYAASCASAWEYGYDHPDFSTAPYAPTASMPDPFRIQAMRNAFFQGQQARREVSARRRKIAKDIFVGALVVVTVVGLVILICAAANNSGGGGSRSTDTWIPGHIRSDGTWVQGHWRTNPNRLRYDNYSYRQGQPLYNQSGSMTPNWGPHYDPTRHENPNYE